MPLCDECKRFDLKSFERAFFGCLAISFTDLERRSQEGCDFCSLIHDESILHLSDLFNEMDRNDQVSANLWVHLSVSGSGKNHKQPGYDRLRITLNSDLLPGAYGVHTIPQNYPHEFCIAADEESPAYKDKIVSGRYLGHNRSSPEYFAALKDWIKECLSSHDLCCMDFSRTQRVDLNDAILPTRCLEVTKKNIFLRNTEGMRGTYIALSHRWNPSSEKCKTTTNNYQQRTEGRDFGELSAVFDDVITVARGLGVQYIWIDSICIIQDGADWNNECLKIEQYYQNSLVTITAVCGTEKHGFLAMKEHNPFEKLVRLPYRSKGKVAGSFYVYKRRIKTDYSYLRTVRQSILLNRGWVFQEWLLSCRNVYYAEGETFLECRSSPTRSICNETINKVLHMPKVDWGTELLSKKEDLSQSGMYFKSDIIVESKRGYDIWYSAVTAYTATALTYPDKDHVTAIAGVAMEISKLISSNLQVGNGPNYMSGLWLEDIHLGLLWRGSAKDSRACNCGASSWSWASRLSAVQWPKRGDHVRPKLKITNPSNLLPLNLIDSRASFNRKQTKFRVTGIVQTLLISVLPMDATEIRASVSVLADADTDTDTDLYENLPEKYRHMSSPSSPDAVGGWAVLDDSLGISNYAYTNIVVLALQIRTRAAQYGQIGPSFLKMGRKVCDVLLIEPENSNNPEDRFRRIGVGCVFDWAIVNSFQNGTETALELV